MINTVTIVLIVNFCCEYFHLFNNFHCQQRFVKLLRYEKKKRFLVNPIVKRFVKISPYT